MNGEGEVVFQMSRWLPKRDAHSWYIWLANRGIPAAIVKNMTTQDHLCAVWRGPWKKAGTLSPLSGCKERTTSASDPWDSDSFVIIIEENGFSGLPKRARGMAWG